MQEDLRTKPNMSYRAMEDNLKRKFGLECKQGKIYKAKRSARLQNEGTHTESFAKLHAYAEVLRRLDPGTVVKFSYQDRQELDVQPIFKMMFVAFAATIHSFLNGSKPFFGSNGTFLKGCFLLQFQWMVTKAHIHLPFVLLRERVLIHGFGFLNV